MSKRKPQRGCCGVCGCAVVAPSKEVQGVLDWSFPGWTHGHHFDDNGNLLRVRCPQHGGLGFPPTPVNSDATVLM